MLTPLQIELLTPLQIDIWLLTPLQQDIVKRTLFTGQTNVSKEGFLRAINLVKLWYNQQGFFVFKMIKICQFRDVYQ